MPYSEFTLESANRLLGVKSQPANLFLGLKSSDTPTWLSDTLARGRQGGQLSLISEKARSEFVVAPMLLAARELSGDRFAIFSGQRLDIDPARLG